MFDMFNGFLSRGLHPSVVVDCELMRWERINELWAELDKLVRQNEAWTPMDETRLREIEQDIDDLEALDGVE
jgi:hypothetical protein